MGKSRLYILMTSLLFELPKVLAIFHTISLFSSDKCGFN